MSKRKKEFDKVRHIDDIPIFVSDEPVVSKDVEWEKYIRQYKLKPFISHWTDGPTALLYYVCSDDEVVEKVRAESDIPIITEKEFKILQSMQPSWKKKK